MYQDQALLLYFCETPLHAGAGDSVTYVDQPIQRDRHTQHPIVQAGGVKGALRDHVQRNCNNKGKIFRAFGPPPKKDPNSDDPSPSDYGGALTFTDAEILFFPVRSDKGLFAWVTCPEVVCRFYRRLKILGWEVPDDIDIEVPAEEALVSFPDNMNRCGRPTLDKIILEDVAFFAKDDDIGVISNLADWASLIFPKQDAKVEGNPTPDASAFLKNRILKRLVILNDDTFRDFATLSTDVITRIRINGDTGTVEGGALWTEEYLPRDSFLFGSLHAADTESRKLVTGTLDKKPLLQIGGNATIGKGLVRIGHVSPEAEAPKGKQGEDHGKE